MIDPDFGEGQLQQVVNTSFTLFAIQHYGADLHPVIPTLVEEFGLGWDSGFYFPWLGYPALLGHEGCNFFVQYKLSSLIEGSRGRQWSNWDQEYFRFRIPHTVKNGSNYVQDFHQFDALKLLSAQSCEVYYATNHLTSRSELFSQAASGTLLDNIPFLDVQDMAEHHHYATFTADSAHFYLHSEPFKSPRLSGKQVASRISQGRKASLAEGNEQLVSGLRLLAESDQTILRHLQQYERFDKLDFPAPRQFKTLAKFHFLRSAFHQAIGVSVYRI